MDAAVSTFAVKSTTALCFHDIKTIVCSWDQRTKPLKNRIAICIGMAEEDVEQSCYQRRADWVFNDSNLSTCYPSAQLSHKTTSHQTVQKLNSQFPKTQKDTMPSTPEFSGGKSERAVITSIAAFELSIEASKAEMEASRMKLMALDARARAVQASKEVLRGSAPNPDSILFNTRPEWDFILRVHLAAIQAKKSVQKLVRCYAQATHAARFGMDNGAADQMQDNSAWIEVLKAIEMAAKAIVPVEHPYLTDRIDNYRFDLIRIANTILGYYAGLPNPQNENSSLTELREGRVIRGFTSYSNSAERNNRVGRQRRLWPRMGEGRDLHCLLLHGVLCSVIVWCAIWCVPRMVWPLIVDRVEYRTL